MGKKKPFCPFSRPEPVIPSVLCEQKNEIMIAGLLLDMNHAPKLVILVLLLYSIIPLMSVSE